MRIRYLALAPLVLLAACGTSADPEATLDTVRLVEQAEIEAIRSDDLDGVMRNYAEDAVLVSPNAAPAEGAAAIRAAFETMLADRPYSRGRELHLALAELDLCAGSHFDPRVVEAFLRLDLFQPAPTP